MNNDKIIKTASIYYQNKNPYIQRETLDTKLQFVYIISCSCFYFHNKNIVVSNNIKHVIELKQTFK